MADNGYYEKIMPVVVDYLLEKGIQKDVAEELLRRELTQKDITAINKELSSRGFEWLPLNYIKEASNEEIMYLDGDVSEENSFSYDRVHHTKYSYHADEPVEVVLPSSMSGSDYSGTTYHRSNYDTFLEKFGDVEGVYSLYGGYGTFAIAIRADLVNEEIHEAIAGLNDYPVLDEDALTEYENELEGEAWNNWARHDFVQSIENRFDIEDLEELMTDVQIEDLFHELCERSNTYFMPDGADMYIRIEDVVAAAEPGDIPGLE